LLFDLFKPLSDEDKMNLVKGIARGMLHLHNHSIVHRDLAARNILLSATGEPKISVSLLSFSLSFLYSYSRFVAFSFLWLCLYLCFIC
jgi:serine/threonine protein kinase